LDRVKAGDLASISIPSFSGRHLEDLILNSKNVRLYIATKNLPSHTVKGIVTADEERNMSEISYFSSTLRGSAALWFNTLTIDPAVAVAGNIGTLAALCTTFEEQYLFDPVQKWRYLSEFLKKKTTWREGQRIHEQNQGSRSQVSS